MILYNKQYMYFIKSEILLCIHEFCLLFFQQLIWVIVRFHIKIELLMFLELSDCIFFLLNTSEANFQKITFHIYINYYLVIHIILSYIIFIIFWGLISSSHNQPFSINRNWSDNPSDDRWGFIYVRLCMPADRNTRMFIKNQ